MCLNQKSPLFSCPLWPEIKTKNKGTKLSTPFFQTHILSRTPQSIPKRFFIFLLFFPLSFPLFMLPCPPLPPFFLPAASLDCANGQELGHHLIFWVPDSRCCIHRNGSTQRWWGRQVESRKPPQRSSHSLEVHFANRHETQHKNPNLWFWVCNFEAINHF